MFQIIVCRFLLKLSTDKCPISSYTYNNKWIGVSYEKNLAGIGVLICFAFMLLFPKDVFNGASKGLLLWFHTVFPTLFPFLIITNLLMSTNCIRLIARLFGPLLNKIFRVSPNGSFAIIAGFLCGYPMGAKISADLTHTKQISPQEGAYLLSFCNNTSPVFIFNFVVWKTLGKTN